MNIGDRLKKRLEAIEKQSTPIEQKPEEQAKETDSSAASQQQTALPAEQAAPQYIAAPAPQPAEQPKKRSIAEILSKRGIEGKKTIEEQVDDLIRQANDRTYDSEDIIRWKEGMPLYVTAMPAITYDHVIIILKKELNVYKDVHEGDMGEFEKVLVLEQEWNSTCSPQKREEFYFALMQLQEEYKPEYTGELALAYLRNLAKGEKK